MSREELEQLTIRKLKAICKERGLTGYAKMSQEELIDLILANPSESEKLDTVLEQLDEAEDTVEEKLDNIIELLDGEENKDGEDKLDKIIELLNKEDDREEDTKDDEGSTVAFKKLIKGAFGFNGNTFKGSTFELSGKEANHPKIRNAIKCGLIEIK